MSCGMEQGGGTLPRHRSSSTNISSAQRQRPIAKVIGNVSMSLQQQQQQLLSNSADFVNEKNTKVIARILIKANSQNMENAAIGRLNSDIDKDRYFSEIFFSG